MLTGVDLLFRKINVLGFFQKSKDLEIEDIKKENEIMKEQLETMKKICMQSDSKIRHYQILEIKLQDCLQKAVQQVLYLMF